MKILKIEAKREGYTPEQCRPTMTVGKLKAFLEEFCDEDLPVYISHDNGYSFGSLWEGDFNEYETEKENENGHRIYSHPHG